MIPGDDDIKYKTLFIKMEEDTGIPGFDDVLNFPARQKKHSGKLVKTGSVLIACLTLVIAIYFYQVRPHHAGVSKNKTVFFQDRKSMVWEWKSPTQQLLSTALTSTFANFKTPTDCLSSLKTSLQISNNKKPN
jgi:hypothetical protein